MKAPPADLDSEALAGYLASGWDLDCASLEYVPVGFGDHHWRAALVDRRTLFVTVRDLRLDDLGQTDAVARLNAVFGAVRALELPFAISPLWSERCRALVLAFDARFAVWAFEWLDGSPPPAEDGLVTVNFVAELHRTWRDRPVDAPRETFRIPHRPSLELALQSLDVAWHSGPYAEPTRMELRSHVDEVRAALARYDAWSSAAQRDVSGWCLTHGEPYRQNQLRTAEGATYLVDWESARIAPPERDLAELHDPALLREYERISAGPPIDAHLIRLYQLQYALAETAVYTTVFRRRHADDPNTRESWQNFQHFVNVL